MHYAITGKTAAEIIHDRADSEHPTMGLTTWKASPNGKNIIKIQLSHLIMEKMRWLMNESGDIHTCINKAHRARIFTAKPKRHVYKAYTGLWD